MARGRRTSFTIRLTPAERRTPLLLLLADGMTITEAAATVGLSRRHSYKWIQRFVQEGLEGLVDKPGRGQRPGPRQYPRTEPDDLFA
jgi:DNA-directed RNA polymerase specialized sigma24 family protein